MPEPDAGVRVLRAADRFRTERDGIVTRHCFAFGDHYDPDNICFADLTAVNDELVEPGHGYGMHRHRDAEIVTWVLEGELEHEDTAGNHGTIGVDTIQRMSAGEGVQHSERNASAHRPARFIQMWLRPSPADPGDPAPSYEQADIGERLERPRFIPAVGAAEDAAIGIGTAGATLWIARLDTGDATAIPTAQRHHLHVVRGAVRLDDGGMLDDGDTMRIDGGVATDVVATVPSELLLWAMHPSS